MADVDLSAFEELASTRYPGSKQTRRMISNPPAVQTQPVVQAWDAKPKILLVRGQEVEFFTVGHLAKALGRTATTIRMWERVGIMPKARFVKKGRDGDVRGNRRLYTRAQVEGVVRIAEEEGILRINKNIPFESTRFTERVLALWQETAL